MISFKSYNFLARPTHNGSSPNETIPRNEKDVPTSP